MAGTPGYQEVEFMPERTVVVAVDLSEHAEKALSWFLEYVSKKDDHVVLVYVPEGPYSDSADTSAWVQQMETNSKEVEVLEQKCLLMVRKYQVCQRANGNNIELMVTFKLQHGSKAGEAIVAAAGEVGAGLIVTGTRGMGVIRRTIMGSVSDYVLHHASCPVLIYRH